MKRLKINIGGGSDRMGRGNLGQWLEMLRRCDAEAVVCSLCWTRCAADAVVCSLCTRGARDREWVLVFMGEGLGGEVGRDGGDAGEEFLLPNPRRYATGGPRKAIGP